MLVEDYYKIINEVVEIDTEVSSIADSRRLLVEINEKEAVLLKLKKNIVRDLRTAESDYIKAKAFIRDKYSMDQNTGITKILKGSPKSKRIKELKRLEVESNKNINGLKELKILIDELLIQFDDIKIPVSRSMKDRFANSSF
jgi:hypothetical protein